MATKTVGKNVYFEGVGRRKTATARARVIVGSAKNSLTINGKKSEEYFNTPELRLVAVEALHRIEGAYFSVTAVVRGGGESAQADAIRHAIARALVKFNIEHRKTLKKVGFLKRDPRMKERKKPGLKKARKAAQWSKR